MTIYEKLQKARQDLKAIKIEKTGVNDSRKAKKYYKLEDVSIPIEQVCANLKIFTMFNFTIEEASLTLFDLENINDTIKFVSPLGSIESKVMSDTQSIGSIQTFQKRFLYINAFSVIDGEDENSEMGENAHDVFVVKSRIEKKLTKRLNEGISSDEIIKASGLKDEKQLQQYLQTPLILAKIEKALDGLAKKDVTK